MAICKICKNQIEVSGLWDDDDTVCTECIEYTKQDFLNKIKQMMKKEFNKDEEEIIYDEYISGNFEDDFFEMHKTFND